MNKKRVIILLSAAVIIFFTPILYNKYVYLPQRRERRNANRIAWQNSQQASSTANSSSSQTASSSIDESAALEAEAAASERDRQWAQSVFDEALQKLVHEGVMQQQAGYLFTYIEIESGEYSVSAPFLSQEGVTKYSKNEAVLGNKLISCFWNFSDSALSVVTNHDSTIDTRYYPSSKTGSTVNRMFSNGRPNRFANNLEECDTLILCGGFESAREEKYYNIGNDRVSITTLVFVIDAKNKTIQHVEVIGTDTPSSTNASYTTGRTKTTEALKYISDLLGD